jgi:tetratricopeptide (TPR) repeat protein
MAGLDEAPHRIEAGLHLSRAHQHLAKHKTDRALEEALLAAEVDPEFEEARQLLVSLYEQLGQPRKAVQQLEHILHLHGGHDDAIIEHIAQLDPAAAERHRRLASIAADPFVAKGRAVDEDLDGFDEMEETAAPAAAPALRVGRADDDAFADMDEIDSDPSQATVVPHHAAADVFADDEGEAEGPRPLAPEEYEYEDERKYRLNAAGLDVLKGPLREHRRMWAVGRSLEELMERTPALSMSGYIPASEAFQEAAARLRTPTTVPHSSADPSLQPLICGPLAAYVMVPRGAVEALTPEEMRFYAGRTLAHIACDHVPLLDLAAALLPPPRPSSALLDLRRQVALEAFRDLLTQGDEALGRPRKSLHTWRLRAALTADRAGLLCCGKLDAALAALAKLTAIDAAGAERLSPETFKQKFEGQDLRQISNLSLDRDPETSEPYAFYRMLMLAWWSKQPAFKRLVGG